MGLRNLMQALGLLLGGLSALWFGLGLALAAVQWIGNWFTATPFGSWPDPGATFLWNYAMPALVGIVLAVSVANVGRRRAA